MSQILSTFQKSDNPPYLLRLLCVYLSLHSAKRQIWYAQLHKSLSKFATRILNYFGLVDIYNEDWWDIDREKVPVTGCNPKLDANFNNILENNIISLILAFHLLINI